MGLRSAAVLARFASEYLVRETQWSNDKALFETNQRRRGRSLSSGISRSGRIVPHY